MPRGVAQSLVAFHGWTTTESIDAGTKTAFIPGLDHVKDKLKGLGNVKEKLQGLVRDRLLGDEESAPKSESGLPGSLAGSIDEQQDAARAEHLRQEAKEMEAKSLDELDPAIPLAAHALVKVRADAQGYAAAAKHALEEATAASVQAQKAKLAAVKADAALAETRMRRRSQIDTFLGNGMADYHAAVGGAMGAYVQEAMYRQRPVAPLYYQGGVTPATTL
mmetsp:Transcript_21873/g.40237  ORF Transcript_21873/g.40237 Transcript_21873/m.40237 type:complete len:220 (-) Transcript_21873:45-704(-)